MPRNFRKDATNKTTKTTGTQVSITAIKIEKQQVERFLAKVPEEFVFWSHDGRVLRDMKDLKDALTSISDQDYTYHANETKKDFSNWVRDIIGDEKLAQDLVMAISREQAAKIVEERYTFLNSQAD
jgi:hypothetical protein